MKLISLHFKSFTDALLKIIKHPIEHLINISVIVIIVTLLSTTLLVGKNLNYWEKNNIIFPQIMIYLKSNATQSDVSRIEATINKYKQKLIKNYQFISKEQGLQEIQQDDQLKEIASDVISENANPLPDVLIVNTATADQKQLSQLKDKITGLTMVDSVTMDINYANKISQLTDFVKKVLLFLEIVFTAILILVIYNMIRLQMLLRQDEINVSRLIGASDSFIMRPLNYYALLQIILSSAISFSLINCLINFINKLFINFSDLFGNDFLLPNFSINQFLLMVLILIVFTIFAVFLAVQWIFRNTEAE